MILRTTNQKIPKFLPTTFTIISYNISPPPSSPSCAPKKAASLHVTAFPRPNHPQPRKSKKKTINPTRIKVRLPLSPRIPIHCTSASRREDTLPWARSVRNCLINLQNRSQLIFYAIYPARAPFRRLRPRGARNELPPHAYKTHLKAARVTRPTAEEREMLRRAIVGGTLVSFRARASKKGGINTCERALLSALVR